MITTSLWQAECAAIIEQAHLLKHPFYQLWTAGALPLEALQVYARQYFHQVLAFPRFLSAVHAHCPDLNQRQQILANLVEEELGAEHHPELWLRFAEGLGISREEVLTSVPNAHTQAAIDTQIQLSNDLPYGAALGVVWAYETQVPAVATEKISGLKTHYGIHDARTLKFFRVHGEADALHSQTEAQIMDSWCDTPAKAAQVQAVVDQTTRALNQILDGVMVEAGLA